MEFPNPQSSDHLLGAAWLSLYDDRAFRMLDQLGASVQSTV